MANLNNVINVFKPLEGKKGIQVFLHGSYADNSTTEFSDIDDFIIIDDKKLPKTEILEIEKILEEIEYDFYRIDPLQHHGHFKIYSSSLNDYDNSFLPLFILDEAISVIGCKKVEAQINYFKTRTGLIHNIRQTYLNIESFYQDFCKLNLYKLKGFIGSIVLMPPMLFQTKGLDYTKKEALLKCKSYFSEDAYKVIQWATDLRSNWKSLLNTEEYQIFVELQGTKVPIEDWRDYADEESPVIGTDHLSNIELTDQLINKFLKECLDLLHDFSLQIKTQDDYRRVYADVEIHSIKLGATLIGQFGEVKSPGISDLDVLVCFPDNIYHDSLIALNNFINSNKERVYMFTHPVLCICESMLPYIKYLHTLSNLIISYNPKSNKIDISFNKKYQEFLNKLWTLSLISHLNYSISLTQFVPIREKLLLLKNIHTSLDNLSTDLGTETSYVKKSYSFREKILKQEENSKIDLEREFIGSERLLHNIINRDSDTDYKRRFIVNRNFIFEQGPYGVIKKDKKMYVSMPELLYELIVDAFKLKPTIKEVKLYLNSFQAVTKITRYYKVPNQFLDLIPFSMKKSETSVYKRFIFSQISRFPKIIIDKIV